MKISTSLLLLHGFAMLVMAGIGPVADLYIVNRDIQPDGFNRVGVLAGASEDGASIPGPLITAKKGEQFRLNVIDNLSNSDGLFRSTSIHWHGLFQAGSSWADGPTGVTQCPIAPGHSFEYRFGNPNQAGTFWYHSHYSVQYCDGLRGALVIYDPKDPHRFLYDIDDDSTVITLADWYHTASRFLLATAAPDPPDSTLINGLGRDPNAKDPLTPLAVIPVIPGKRYRFRLVSISCDPNFKFSIDGHLMTIIEVDGENVVPLEVDSIQIFPGQRYSFVLKANQKPDNYWIRALPNVGVPPLSMDFTHGSNSAILRYISKGVPQQEPKAVDSPPRSWKPLLETNLHPLENERAPGIPKLGHADVNLTLNITFNTENDGLFRINGSTFEASKVLGVPVLLQILNGRDPGELLPAGSVYKLPRNKVVELRIPAEDTGGPHPFHLHGHSFSVVKSAGRNSIPNFKNPVRRDVVSIGAEDDRDMVVIRFTTDNPGPWILHCHIDWHLEAGLAIVFAEDIPSIQKQPRPPAEWDELCDIWNELPEAEH